MANRIKAIKFNTITIATITMEKSRSFMIIALILTFVSQFFTVKGAQAATATGFYEADNISYVRATGDGAHTGWQIHPAWFFAPLLVISIYLFYTSVREKYIYWLALILLIYLGLEAGHTFWGYADWLAILIAAIAVLMKYSEAKIRKA